jgi:hypothetical protein
LAGLRGRCEGSFGGGTGGTVPGDISDSLSGLHDGVSEVIHTESRCTSGSETWRDKAGPLCSPPCFPRRERQRETRKRDTLGDPHHRQRPSRGAPCRGSATAPTTPRSCSSAQLSRPARSPPGACHALPFHLLPCEMETVTYRVLRSLFVFTVTGVPLSEPVRP